MTSESGTEPIREGSEVTLHFSLALQDGSVIDSNFDSSPVTFTMGDGNLLPGFEGVLQGLVSGTKQRFDILPEQGFGQRNANNVQRIKRDSFTGEMELAPGLVVSFADANNAERPGVIVDFDDDFVTVDFNHPLAGHVIRFDVNILDVRTPGGNQAG